MENLNRVETVLSAISEGVIAEWAENSLIAHGWAGQRNGLGYALDHLLAYPSHGNIFLAVFLLSGELTRQQVCKSRDATDLAQDAIHYWLTWHCPTCKGRGVLDIEQHQCQQCGGTGHKPKPAHIERPLAVIEAAVEWMEGQLRKRLSRA